MSRTTLHDIAKQAGVGVATVDRVLNGRAPVRPVTAERVLAAAEALDYYAHGLMRRRIEEMAPAKTLGFILQKQGKWFYQSLARNIRESAAGLRDIRASAEIEFVESLSPDDMAIAIGAMAEKVDAIALVAVDHPKVNAAIEKCVASGMPVFALISNLSNPSLSGYIGIDGRKAGRTAGWVMSRLNDQNGEIGILIGSHRYVVQEDRETGFRSYMREHAPQTRLLDSIVFLDDAAVAYKATADILRAAPNLTGLYHCGGGVEGAVRALKEARRDRDVFYVCHERSPFTVQGLLEGSVDLVISNPGGDIARHTTLAMAQALSGQDPAAARASLDFQLITAENV